MGLAGLGSGSQPHYEATDNLHIRDVIVSCPKLALHQLIQIQVMNLASYTMLQFYIYNTNPQVYDIINWLNKNLKVHFVLNFYKETRSDIET